MDTCKPRRAVLEVLAVGASVVWSLAFTFFYRTVAAHGVAFAGWFSPLFVLPALWALYGGTTALKRGALVVTSTLLLSHASIVMWRTIDTDFLIEQDGTYYAFNYLWLVAFGVGALLRGIARIEPAA